MHIVYVKKPRPERWVALTAALAGFISILLPVQPATAGEGLAEVLSTPRAETAPDSWCRSEATASANMLGFAMAAYCVPTTSS